MSRVAVIGDDRRLGGYALAGATVLPAASPADAEAAWERLPDDVALVVVTQDVRAALGARLEERDDLVWTVLP